MKTIALNSGRARAELAPGLGGALTRFAVGAREVLRPTARNPKEARDTACYPLVPFANRIRDGAFDFEGRTVRLKPNMDDHPHPLHGQGWRSAWTAAAVSSDRAILVMEHAADDWPWAWRAEQAFTLRDDGLRIELTLVNADRKRMPAGLGLHPFFPATSATRLKAATDGVWLVKDHLPERHHAGVWGRDWRAGAPVAGLDVVDHCFTGWTGRAEVSEPGGATTVVTASPNCRWLQAYIPPRQGFLCVEPATHMPDPFAPERDGLAVLEPGEALSIWIDVSLSARGA
jgi:aldose 1-epimerase